MKETLQIFVLIVGLSFVTFFMYFFRFNSKAQLIVGLLGCVYYTVWGIIHHALKERLSRTIILEYILLGSVVFLLLLLSLVL